MTDVYVFLAIGAALIGLLVFAGKYVSAAATVINFMSWAAALIQKLDLLFLFTNRPKTDKEWADWRRLKATKASDLSAKDKARLRELEELNKRWRDKQ